ncbi:TPA: hypothetical protein ACJOGX_004662 [Enterobacter kobei]|nr:MULTISPECIES: hypothetical protein [Enterobacteriaceae]MCU3131766.1 hypothetical protein [Enterobacter roggenkampii]
MLNQQAQTQSATAKKTGLSFLLILSALMAVTSLSTDIYLPAMPMMAKDLQGDCCGQLKLATALEFFQYRFSDSFGGNPPLYSCGLSAL